MNIRQQPRIVELTLETNRILLTRGKSYSILKSKLPSNQIFNVTEQDTPNQLLQVLKHYNVRVKKSDLFSRCPICNGDEFIKRTSQEVPNLKISLFCFIFRFFPNLFFFHSFSRFKKWVKNVEYQEEFI